MQKPDGYDDTVVTSGFEPLDLGGHYLIILGAKQETLNGYDVLTIQFDTHPGDPQPNYYQDDYKRRKESNADAKYQGTHRLFLPAGDKASDNYKWANQRLKGFIQSVEATNPGFKFNWDERTLKQKAVGGVFGEEEYLANDGTVKKSIRLRYFCENEYVPKAGIPKVKELKTKSTGSFFPGDDDALGKLPFDI